MLHSTRCIALASLLAFSGVYDPVPAQTPGAIDPTFHSSDPGWNRGLGFSNQVQDIAMQSDGKAIMGGYFTGWIGELPGAATLLSDRAIARINTDGTRDETFGSVGSFNGFNNGGVVRRLKVLADGSVLAIGTFSSYAGTSRNNIVKLTSTGALDNSFTVGTGFNNSAYDLCVQNDGKVVVVGPFTSYNGNPCGKIARLNADGSFDASFQSGAGFTSSGVASIVCTANAIYAGGWNMVYNGTSSSHLICILLNGTRDMTFAPTLPFTNSGVSRLALNTGRLMVGISYSGIYRFYTTGAADPSFTTAAMGSSYINDMKVDASGNTFVCSSAGTVNGQGHYGIFKLTYGGTVDASFATTNAINTEVLTVGVQTDGKVILACNSHNTTFSGYSKPYVLRLTAAGSLDVAYAPGSGFITDPANGTYMFDMVVQPDGRMITCGRYEAYDQITQGSLTRLTADGALDPAFIPGSAIPSPGVGYALALQTDGKILLGGWFSAFSGAAHGSLVRLNANGTIDGTFNIGTGFADGYVRSIAVQGDGKILVAGRLTTLNGASCGDLVRLNTDGSIDNGFTQVAISSSEFQYIRQVVVQADGRILVCGDFTALGGVTKNRIARFEANGVPDASFVTGSGLDASAERMLVKGDGHILVGGSFANYNGSAASCLVEIGPDGSMATNFHAPAFWASSEVRDIRLAANGKILVCGDIRYGGGGHSDVVRLYANGQADDSFHVQGGSFSGTTRLAVLGDGKVMAMGEFFMFQYGNVKVGRNRIARLNGGDPQVRVSPKVFLEGPFVSGTNLMNDALRTGGLVPTQEPYTGGGFAFAANGGGETVPPTVFNTTGNNAIVDWVVVELRDTSNAATVLASRSALVQRDGDVVDLDGTSSLLVNGSAGKYYVAVRHRNHLGVMTATPATLSTSSTTLVDFTDGATTTYGSSALKLSGSKMVLWAGDATGDGSLKYTGSGNDRDPIILAVGGTTPNNVVSNVYDRRDTNLDGVIKYTGTGNDRDIILTNVGSTTPNNTRTQQLP